MWTGVRLLLRPLLRLLLPAPLRTALTRLVADWACCAVWRWPGSRTAAAVWAGIGASPWCGGAAWSCSDWSGTRASSWESSWEWSCAAEEAGNRHRRKISIEYSKSLALIDSIKKHIGKVQVCSGNCHSAAAQVTAYCGLTKVWQVVSQV